MKDFFSENVCAKILAWSKQDLSKPLCDGAFLGLWMQAALRVFLRWLARRWISAIHSVSGGCRYSCLVCLGLCEVCVCARVSIRCPYILIQTSFLWSCSWVALGKWSLQPMALPGAQENTSLLSSLSSWPSTVETSLVAWRRPWFIAHGGWRTGGDVYPHAISWCQQPTFAFWDFFLKNGCSSGSGVIFFQPWATVQDKKNLTFFFISQHKCSEPLKNCKCL